MLLREHAIAPRAYKIIRFVDMCALDATTKFGADFDNLQKTYISIQKKCKKYKCLTTPCGFIHPVKLISSPLLKREQSSKGVKNQALVKK